MAMSSIAATLPGVTVFTRIIEPLGGVSGAPEDINRLGKPTSDRAKTRHFHEFRESRENPKIKIILPPLIFQALTTGLWFA
jgi:hypothetical protein